MVGKRTGSNEKDTPKFQMSDDDDFDAVGSHDLAISIGRPLKTNTIVIYAKEGND